MSRTTRRNHPRVVARRRQTTTYSVVWYSVPSRAVDHIVPDGKTAYRCNCTWCTDGKLHKHLRRGTLEEGLADHEDK